MYGFQTFEYFTWKNDKTNECKCFCYFLSLADIWIGRPKMQNKLLVVTNYRCSSSLKKLARRPPNEGTAVKSQCRKIFILFFSRKILPIWTSFGIRMESSKYRQLDVLDIGE